MLLSVNNYEIIYNGTTILKKKTNIVGHLNNLKIKSPVNFPLILYPYIIYYIYQVHIINNNLYQ